jgi:hypothetical protein
MWNINDFYSKWFDFHTLNSYSNFKSDKLKPILWNRNSKDHLFTMIRTLNGYYFNKQKDLKNE